MKTKAEILHSVNVVRWKAEVAKVEEPYRSQMLSVWNAIMARAGDKIVQLPKIDRAPSEGGKPFLCWHKNGFHIAIYFFEKLYIFCRNNGASTGEEAETIPDFFADIIIGWKPGKSEDHENE